jgi:hypothetical protein
MGRQHRDDEVTRTELVGWTGTRIRELQRIRRQVCVRKKIKPELNTLETFLTKSASSSAAAQTHGCVQEKQRTNMIDLLSRFCFFPFHVHPTGSAHSLHHFGVAHQTSLRSSRTMMSSSNSPHRLSMVVSDDSNPAPTPHICHQLPRQSGPFRGPVSIDNCANPPHGLDSGGNLRSAEGSRPTWNCIHPQPLKSELQSRSLQAGLSRSTVLKNEHERMN